MTVHARWPLAAIRGFHRFTASLGSANGWQRIRTVRPQKAVRVLGGMKAKEAREPDYSAIDLAIYAKVLLLVKSITCHNDLARISEVRAALLRFGIEPGAASYVLLLQLRHSQPCPLHLALLKRLANSLELVRRLDGAVLTEFQLDLSNYREVFSRLTSSFFHDQSGVDEIIAWYAAAALDQAIINGEKAVGDIHTMRHLLRIASKPCK